jgi:hypothetical protein
MSAYSSILRILSNVLGLTSFAALAWAGFENTTYTLCEYGLFVVYLLIDLCVLPKSSHVKYIQPVRWRLIAANNNAMHHYQVQVYNALPLSAFIAASYNTSRLNCNTLCAQVAWRAWGIHTVHGFYV